MGAEGEPVAASQPGNEGLLPLADHLRALANDKRLHLLAYLTEPHYVEEISEELKVSRQAVQVHLEKLLEVGVVERVRGRRDTGPVTEFVVVPHRLFAIQEDFAQLGRRLPPADGAATLRTQPAPDATRAGPQRMRPCPWLTIVHGLRPGVAVALEGQGPWMVGRDARAHLSLDYDPYASSRHCEVRRAALGYDVADLYSSNGTTVDWTALPRGGTQPVVNGSLIRLGRTTLLFRTPA